MAQVWPIWLVWHSMVRVILRLYCIVGPYLYDMSYANMAWICRPILRFLLFVIVLEFVACYLICLRGSNADFWIFDPRNAFSSLFWLFVRLSVVLQPLFLRLCMAVLFGILLMCNEVCNFSQFSLFDFSRCLTFLRLLYKSNFRDVPMFWDFLCKSNFRDVPTFWDLIYAMSQFFETFCAR